MSPIIIEKVEKGGLFERAGIKAGSRIISINGMPVRDPLDFSFYSADDELLVEVELNGSRSSRRIIREEGTAPGVVLKELSPRRCGSKCVFCFIDQLPPGLRKTLYLKDEDFRFSFLHGNFVTLANLRSGDLERIVEQHLSPLYVSVHSTDPGMRRKLLGIENADIMPKLLFLKDGGIELHCQIVICPGLNDGAGLEKTINDLTALVPAVSSVGVVPVGITRFRDGLFPIEPVSRECAAHAVEFISSAARKLRRKSGKNIVHAADELFHLAGKDVPGPACYDDYPQIENGIGIERRFIDLAAAGHFSLPRDLKIHGHSGDRGRLKVSVVTGTLISGTMRKCIGQIRTWSGVEIEVVPVENNFFGTTVSVSGLLTGEDIIRGVLSAGPGDVAIVPPTAVSRFGVFLDDISTAEVEKQTGRIVRVGFEHGNCTDSYCRHYW